MEEGEEQWGDDDNRARPEGSIAKGYGTEEVIEFCVDFIPDINPIGVPESRHKGRLSGKGILGKKTYISKGDDYFNKAHYTVLQNSSLVDLYIETHKNLLRSEFSGKSEAWITRQHMKLSATSYEKNVRVMRVLMRSCICWLGSHRGISSHTKGTR